MEFRTLFIVAFLGLPLLLPAIGLYLGIRRKKPFWTAFSSVFLLGATLGVCFLFSSARSFMEIKQQQVFFGGLPVVSFLSLAFYRRDRFDAFVGWLAGLATFYPFAIGMFVLLCGGFFGVCFKM